MHAVAALSRVRQWAASGVTYPELLDRLIRLARERHAEKQQLRTSLP
jgi:hypothetical protein